MELSWALDALDFRAIIDILLVAIFLFSVTLLFRGTQAGALMRGTMIVILSFTLISFVLDLVAVSWVMGQLLTVAVIAIPVIFQPELRRILEQLGRGSIIGGQQTPVNLRSQIIEEICEAAAKLSDRRHGALIVIQRESALDEYIRSGVPLDSLVSAELLLTIFWPKTELHDGAAIIDKRGVIAAAASVLPLTASRNLPNRQMGTRHRAALGISEVGDALCVIVSEETGRISITNGGRMVSRLDIERLRTILNAFYGPESQKDESLIVRLRNALTDVLGRKAA